VVEMLYDLRGFPETKSLFEIRGRLFPLHWRILDSIRLLVSRDTTSPAWQLIKDVSKSSSSHEVDGAFFNYEVHPMRASELSHAILGRPRLGRALRFYSILRSNWMELQRDKKLQNSKI
jgi:hypothetical protein